MFKAKCEICKQKFEAYTENQLKNMVEKHNESNAHKIKLGEQVKEVKN